MPRDILSDSLAVLRIVEHEDEENWPLDDKPACKQNSKKLGNLTLNSQHSYTRDDCACYYNYGLGDGGNNRQLDLLYQYKTNSLPATSTINWHVVICSALKILPEDIANQLTLLDMQCFKQIKADELITCGWTKLNKATVAPNVVAFTKRFNRVSFWTVQEILNEPSPKSRAEAIAHFIKVAKKLHELNNLHSLFAVISALNSASIYRLRKSWACLSKKDKQQFDKLAELLCEQDNWIAFREYLKSVTLPCIPYLGIFLTDLVYIDIAHPPGSPHRMAKMSVVLQALERFQTSEYDVPPLPPVADFLDSVRYIEELQKFLEDDQYKLSLKLEPPSPIGSYTGSRESVLEASGASGSFNTSPNHRSSLRVHNQSRFMPTHRKSRSLGSNIFGKSHNDGKMSDKTPAGSVNLLDDTLLESPESGAEDKSKGQRGILAQGFETGFQSFVRRKTVLKYGRKPSLSSWQRYWIQISGNTLLYYSSKSFKGTNRGDFRSEHCKLMNLEGWMAVMVDGSGSDGTEGSDVFQLINNRVSTLYKFKTGSEATARRWVSEIMDVLNKLVKPLPTNLMSFE